MKKLLQFGSLIVLTALFITAAAALAQKGVVLTQKSFTFSSQALYAAAENAKNMDDPKARADFFLSVPLEDLLQAAKAAGTEPEMEESTISIQGGNMRVDLAGENGKETIILNKKTGMMYRIVWAQGTYSEMSLAQLKQMRENAMKQIQQMPDMQAMLDRLPPEARQKAMEALQQAGKMPGASKAKPQHVATGRKMTLHGFACEEHRIYGKSKSSVHWVTRSNPHLVKIYRDVISEWQSDMPDMDEGEDISKFVPDAVPIVERSFSSSGYGGNLNVEEVTSVKEKPLSPNLFAVDKTKLRKVSMMEGMMPPQKRK